MHKSQHAVSLLWAVGSALLPTVGRTDNILKMAYGPLNRGCRAVSSFQAFT